MNYMASFHVPTAVAKQQNSGAQQGSFQRNSTHLRAIQDSFLYLQRDGCKTVGGYAPLVAGDDRLRHDDFRALLECAEAILRVA